MVAVAFSGGRDSLALLHASCRAAQALGLQVLALHVHHNLLPEADAWLASARRLCARWARNGWPLTLRWTRLSSAPAAGDSLEAWARAGRHQALAAMAREAGASLLLLGQHRRDQAETVLLQLLRGAGTAGLAAMPGQALRDGLVWARPWLEQPREAIEAYVARHRLRPVEDPSNADVRLARNRLRLQVWPALCQAFPEAEVALSLAARRAHEADAALAELAAADQAVCCEGQALRIEAWRGLSPARRALLLRAWWRSLSGRGATEALVQRLLQDLADPARRTGRWPTGGAGMLRLYRGRLELLIEAARPAQPSTPAPTLDLSRPGLYALPAWGAAIEVQASAAQDALPAEALRAVQWRPRRGGERFQAGHGRPPRALKKQFQAAAVPADQREAPLLWTDDGRLLFVPGLGTDARAWAEAGRPALQLRWRPGPGGACGHGGSAG